MREIPVWAALAALAAIGAGDCRGFTLAATLLAYRDTFDRDSYSPEGITPRTFSAVEYSPGVGLRFIGLTSGAQLVPTSALGGLVT
ncbi:MAG: hypothetical protein IPG56_20760 [Caulobacteraceae bacterium]|nr:hypothetical protein [Caulobacteraceae bacterium]